MTPLHLAIGLALLATALAAAIDHRTGLIPNWLTLPALAAGLAGHGIVGGVGGLAASLVGALACALVPWLLFRKGALGGGDVKLFAALGALLGLRLGLDAELLAFVCAAVLALGQLARQGRLRVTLGNAGRLLLRRPVAPELMTTARMGMGIFAGTALAVALASPRLFG